MLTDADWDYSPYLWVNRAGNLDLNELFKHPGPMGQLDRGGPRRKVCVIGGGIAGLTAAYELGLLGHQITLLEASDRFGGRILTHYFSDGTYGELGAMRIPKEHACVFHYIQQFGLKCRRFVSSNNKGLYWLRGGRKLVLGNGSP